MANDTLATRCPDKTGLRSQQDWNGSEEHQSLQKHMHKGSTGSTSGPLHSHTREVRVRATGHNVHRTGEGAGQKEMLQGLANPQCIPGSSPQATQQTDGPPSHAPKLSRIRLQGTLPHSQTECTREGLSGCAASTGLDEGSCPVHSANLSCGETRMGLNLAERLSAWGRGGGGAGPSAAATPPPPPPQQSGKTWWKGGWAVGGPHGLRPRARHVASILSSNNQKQCDDYPPSPLTPRRPPTRALGPRRPDAAARSAPRKSQEVSERIRRVRKRPPTPKRLPKRGHKRQRE